MRSSDWSSDVCSSDLDADWRRLSDCLWGAGGAECRYQPLYTACPAPESDTPGDVSRAGKFAVEVLPPPQPDALTERVLRISWRYLNQLGGVPERDDVRFNIAVSERDIPAADSPPDKGDYPRRDEARDDAYLSLEGAFGFSASARLLRNASYAGHAKWTEPDPAKDLPQYRVDHPAASDPPTHLRPPPKPFPLH